MTAGRGSQSRRSGAATPAAARPVLSTWPAEMIAATWVFAIFGVGALAWWMWLGRGTTFYYDEWDFILAYQENLWSAMISPHVGQLVAVPVIVYRAMFALVGLRHYWPYRLVGILFELGMVTTTFVYLRRRIRPLIALVAAFALLACGQAFQDILWPFELTFTISLGTGVGALILLDCNSRAGQITAAACLMVSVASSGLGLIFVAGIAVEFVWSALFASERPHQDGPDLAKRLGRIWVVLPGLGLYLAWYVHGHIGDAILSRVHEVPGYVMQSAGYAVGSLLGLRSLAVGEVLSALVASILAMRLVLDWRTAARLIMAVVAALTFWTLAALARGEAGAGSSRYLQPDGLLVILALAELGTGTWTDRIASRAASWGEAARGAARRPAQKGGRVVRSRSAVEKVVVPPSTALLAALMLVAVFAALSNSVTLLHGSRGLREISVLVTADLRAVQLADNELPAGLQPLPTDAPQNLRRTLLGGRHRAWLARRFG